MKILQLAAYYNTNNLYKDLFTNLSRFDIEQEVYVNTYNKTEYEFLNDKIKFNTFNNLEFKDKFLMMSKAKTNYENVVNNIDLKSVDLIHAHTWFSDGTTAYKLKKEYGIKYMMAIRSTDMNVFYKYYIHLRKHALEIIKEAEKIVFISHSYKNMFLEILRKNNLMELSSKVMVIPNGINDFWYDNLFLNRKNNKEKVRLIYVGNLDDNKNIKTVFDIVNDKLDDRYSLKIVGSGKNFDYMKKANKNDEKIKLYGRVTDKNKLLKLYRDSDIFIMPSKKETFGNVYIEALTQGLPIVYTKNQGVDGYFNEDVVGIAVNPMSHKEIIDAINLINENYESYSNAIGRVINNFSCDYISNFYKDIYRSIIASNK